MDKKILNKIETLKEIYIELKEQFKIYENIDKKFKNTAILAIQKKSEEVIEYSIKINRLILKKENIFAISYQESFLKLTKLGFDKELCKELATFAIFRNKLAHEYLIITPKESIEQAKQIIKIFPKYLKKIIQVIEK